MSDTKEAQKLVRLIHEIISQESRGGGYLYGETATQRLNEGGFWDVDYNCFNLGVNNMSSLSENSPSSTLKFCLCMYITL